MTPQSMLWKEEQLPCGFVVEGGYVLFVGETRKNSRRRRPLCGLFFVPSSLAQRL